MVQAKLPWLICTGCGGHNPPDKAFCGDCRAAKNEPSRWLDVLPRSESTGKSKGKGKAESETKSKGKGKDPSYRKPKPPQLGDWVQVARKAAAGQPAGQPAGQGSARAGAPKSDTEKRQATEIATLQRQLAARKAATGPATASEDVPVDGEVEVDWACPLCNRSHYNHALKNCRICGTSRTTASATAATPGRSLEEVAAARARLLASKESLAATGGSLDPAILAAAVKDIDAKLRSLDAPSASPTAYEVFEQARLAEAKAGAFSDKLTDKAKEFEDRFNAAEADMDASVRAMAIAHQLHLQAKEALAAATAALQVDADAQGVKEAFAQRAHTETVQAVLQHVAQLITEELTQNLDGMDKDSLLHSMLTKLAGYVSAPPVARTPAGPAAPPTAPTHGACGACGASGDGRLPQRASPKTLTAAVRGSSGDRRQQDASRQRSEARAADLATRRVGGEPDGAAVPIGED